jgi:hypothetical protein
MKPLHLYSAVYSKAKTIAKAIENLKTYPEQGVNCKKAIEYSMEFTMEPGIGKMVGTLSEYKNDSDTFILHFLNGCLLVKKEKNCFIPFVIE